MTRPRRLLSVCAAALACAIVGAESATSNHQTRSRQHAQLARREIPSTEKRGENHGMATFYVSRTGDKAAQQLTEP